MDNISCNHQKWLARKSNIIEGIRGISRDCNREQNWILKMPVLKSCLIASPGRARLLAVSILCLVQWDLAASPTVAVGDYLLSTWRTEDGLPENSINSIAQTGDGYLWLGTRNGVARFDGLKFDTFLPGDTFPDTFSYAKRLSSDGDTLWILSNNG